MNNIAVFAKNIHVFNKWVKKQNTFINTYLYIKTDRDLLVSPKFDDVEFILGYDKSLAFRQFFGWMFTHSTINQKRMYFLSVWGKQKLQAINVPLYYNRQVLTPQQHKAIYLSMRTSFAGTTGTFTSFDGIDDYIKQEFETKKEPRLLTKELAEAGNYK